MKLYPGMGGMDALIAYVCAGENGQLECFDLRAPRAVGGIDAAAEAGAGGQSLTALRFDDRGTVFPLVIHNVITVTPIDTIAHACSGVVCLQHPTKPSRCNRPKHHSCQHQKQNTKTQV